MMSCYTHYFLHQVDDRVVRVTHITAPDDGRAIETAEAWPWNGAIEIWNGKRHVLRLKLDEGPRAA